ncbi:hypothetical protein EYF80_038355 [Liparis tanakae]|uniref:Uncharacterized protein n=1 Tax=Liparis tanakae TaxID=230148 RepID=A0A4Z2GEX2_9TELE|nr:hypothetical protein EYF80_038355 [Liparis tanakae]
MEDASSRIQRASRPEPLHRETIPPRHSRPEPFSRGFFLLRWRPNMIKAGTDREGQTEEDTVSRRWMEPSSHIRRLSVRPTGYRADG